MSLRRRQFVTGGAALLAAAVTASRAAPAPVPEAADPILEAIEATAETLRSYGACSLSRMLSSGSSGVRQVAGGPIWRPRWLASARQKGHLLALR
jgi:hypothetical protein